MARTSLDSVDLSPLQPLRCEPWREVSGRVVIERARPQVRGLAGLGRLLKWFLEPRSIRLDELGSFAWLRFDGTTSVGEVAHAMREAFTEGELKIEERLAIYIHALRYQEVLAIPGVDKAPKRGY